MPVNTLTLSSSQRRHLQETAVGDGGSWTPSDTEAVPQGALVYVNDPGGDVKVKFASGNTFTFKSYVGWLPASVQYVLATGTTATDIGVFI